MAEPGFEVSVELADGRVAVVVGDGAAESRATIERSAEADVHGYIPIGTRDAAHLTMLLDGIPVVLEPGPGRYTRGSYKVEAVHRAGNYLFAAASEVSSRLSRDGARLGEFTRVGKADIRTSWHSGAAVSTGDAAVGYALAAAFGTGAKRFLMILLEGGLPDSPV